MNIKKIFALMLAVLMLLSTFAGCRKVAGNDSVLSSVNSDAVLQYSNVDIIENESEPQSVVDTTSESVDSSSTPASGENVTSSNTSSESTVSVDEPNVNLNPDGIEIYGSGTTDDPYIDTPNADTRIVKTLSIHAGKSVFYSIYRVGGRILTINSSSVYVICNGTRYDAQDGKVSFKVVDALASDAVTFEIGNTGTAAASFTIAFTDLEGSMANPTILKSVGSNIVIDFEEGNETGVFYKYNAEKDGTIRFYLLSGTDKGILVVTNNRSMASRSTESSEEGEVKTDDNGSYVELEVEKGDEISINVGAKPNKRGKYPAVTIEWLAQY